MRAHGVASSRRILLADGHPSEYLEAVIHVDLSKLVPRRAYGLVAGLVPGVFFEASVLLGNPNLMRSYVNHARLDVGLGYYSCLILALALAWIIGSAFLLFVSLGQWLLAGLYTLRSKMWREACRRALIPYLTRRLRSQKVTFRRGVVRLLQYAGDKLTPPFRLRELYRASDAAVTALLKKHYGIDRQISHRDWQVWYTLFGRPTSQDMRGDLPMLALHATGWSGVAAAFVVAPALKNPDFLVFSFFLILCGLIHDWFVAARRANPVLNAIVRARAILAELRDAAKSKVGKIGGPEDSSNGSEV